MFISGKVWKAKEEDDIQIHEDADTATEWDEVLRSATEEELVDLAGGCKENNMFLCDYILITFTGTVLP